MVAQKHSPLEVKIARTAEEREAIFHFRYQVYVNEMKQQQDYADHRRQWLRDSADEGAILFYIASGREVVATLRHNPGSSLSLWPAGWRDAFALDRFAEFRPAALSVSSRFMIARHWRNNTLLARRLAVAAYCHGREQGIRFDFTLSRLHQIDLYEYLGFRRYTRNYQETDQAVGLLVPMVCDCEDTAHLRSVGSPFARAVRHFSADPTTGVWLRHGFPEQADSHPVRMNAAERWSQLTQRLGASPKERIPILQGVSAPEAQALLKRSVQHRVRAGEVILEPGDHIGALFIVISGAVALSFPECDHPSRTLSSGDYFGAEGLLENSLSEAKIVAQSDAQLLVLPEEALAQGLEAGSQAAHRVLFNLAWDRNHPTLHPVPAAARFEQNSTAA